jgi:predicted TIM-barrel fold metal-dependent hydrolase
VNQIPGSIHSTLRGIEIPESIRAANIVNHISTLMVPLAELLFSGILDRFSKLRVVLAEGGASWVPWILGMCDYQGERSMYRGNSSTWPLKMRPSDYWKRQCAAGFWSDQISPYTLDFMGEDTVMWEGDYPHGIVTWPNSREIQNFSLLKVTDEKQRAKILAGNAVRMFNLA